MDMVVSRLSEIEAASVRIMDEAAAQKKELDQQMSMDLQRYDQEIDAQTNEALLKLKEELSLENEKALAQLQKNTGHTIDMLEADYMANHVKLAAAVLQKLVEE